MKVADSLIWLMNSIKRQAFLIISSENHQSWMMLKMSMIYWLEIFMIRFIILHIKIPCLLTGSSTIVPVLRSVFIELFSIIGAHRLVWWRKWVEFFSENRAKYVFKGDDDTLVNPFELKKLIDTDLERQSKLKEKEASIYGSLLETQPVERHSTKYGDNLWPSKDYPTYVSGNFQNF